MSIGAFDDPAAIPLEFEWGTEGRLPQIAQLGHVEGYVSEVDDADGAARARASNHQHPDHDTAVWPPV